MPAETATSNTAATAYEVTSQRPLPDFSVNAFAGVFETFLQRLAVGFH
jgi:hypothetical protein